MNYINLNDCKHGYLYKIDSRNLSYGVFNKNENGFVGIREKFGEYYLDTEFHYDTGAPFGTVRPLAEVKKLPENIEIKESFDTPETIGLNNKIRVVKQNDKLFKWIDENSNEN